MAKDRTKPEPEKATAPPPAHPVTEANPPGSKWGVDPADAVGFAASLVTGGPPGEPIPPVAPPDPPAPVFFIPPKARRATVSVPGTHVKDVAVEVPADAKDPQAAAIEAAKLKLGIWNFGAGPVVEFLE